MIILKLEDFKGDFGRQNMGLGARAVRRVTKTIIYEVRTRDAHHSVVVATQMHVQRAQMARTAHQLNIQPYSSALRSCRHSADRVDARDLQYLT